MAYFLKVSKKNFWKKVIFLHLLIISDNKYTINTCTIIFVEYNTKFILNVFIVAVKFTNKASYKYIRI